MKKKLIIFFSILIVVLLTSAISFAVPGGFLNPKHKPSDYKIGVPYEEAIKSDKPMMALFYVDWCGYCLKFMPKYSTINKLYNDKYNVVMLNAEDEANKALVEDVDLTGFPTLYIIDPKYDNRVHITNGIYMDMKKLRVELDRYLRIRALLDKNS